jgi:toxin-antitoxin system PIN domain toxin
MILCDSNIWLALALSKHSAHASAHRWFAEVNEPRSVSFCRATQQSFLRLLTSASVLASFGSPPLTNREAWSRYDALLADDRVVFQAHEPVGLEDYWKLFALRNTPSPKLWMEAYLAAFARAGGYQFVTTDRAFLQFASLELTLINLL